MIYCRPPHPVLWWLGFLWSLPLTLSGCLVVACGGARFFRREGPYRAWFFLACSGGLLSRFFSRFPFSGFTWGAIVVASTVDYADMLLFQVHESRHVQQGFCLGLFLPLLYVASSLWEYLHGHHFYRDNWFERDAKRASGEA